MADWKNSPHFARHNGTWWVMVPRDQWVEGQTIEVTLKNGTTKDVLMGGWVEEHGDMLQVEVLKDPQEQESQSTSKGGVSAGGSASPKQLKFLRRLIANNSENGVICLDSQEIIAPTAAQISRMSRKEASEWIDLIINDEM